MRRAARIRMAEPGLELMHTSSRSPAAQVLPTMPWLTM